MGAGEVGCNWLHNMPQAQPMAIIPEWQDHRGLLKQVMKGWWVEKIPWFKMEGDAAL